MDAQALVHELRAIEKEIMELEARTAELVRRRQELLPGRLGPRTVLSMEEQRRMLRKTAGLDPEG